ncbi:hypothetical protein [Jannaschia seohaensis]|uniref:DUF2157 domain-containing protein n=1 Tax=Jannaschia seohaensis TaxID=475081 RepID=A0A2Y9BXR3_9RHOB|nr:hypothetical protein [Jannaschia seohaensis]PWJ20862.1 hypothetical protein BCF38_102108 [Jannaschia seohaensis]SSA41272.1 hypothetical protein SAMN05421539_102108 [Jannaschia seohaensis]
MYVVADTHRLLAEGALTPAQVDILRAQARETMMKLAINLLLTGGILAATLGLIFWLAEPLPVAGAGAVALAGGLLALAKGGETLRFFGNAAALIGAGLLLGGAAFELMDKYEDIAGPAMLLLGAAVAGGFGMALGRPRLTSRFACGAIGLMGLALHLTGLAALIELNDITGWPVALASLYAAAALVGAGIVTDLRVVTALAIVPFAQALSTGTIYWHAAYVFYSPEPTLSILQMGALVAGGLWAAHSLDPRWGRHGGILAIMAAIVANLCALVGSLFGDRVGETLWGPGRSWWSNREAYESQEAWAAALDAFNETALFIPEGVYSILWALALAAAVFWAAHKARRGLFNAAVTFAGIHAYTQAFETYHDEPLVYVVGGLAAIPLAWGLWQLDRRWMEPRAS